MNRYSPPNFQSLMQSISKMIVLFLIPLSAIAARNVGILPHEEHFDLNNYSDIVWLTQGATHTWMPGAGWQGGGAAKFTPVTNGQGYCGLGQFNDLRGPQGEPITQLNVRWLMYHGSTWAEYGPEGGGALNKVLINVRSSGSRPMIIERNHNDYATWGACNGTECRYEGGDFWPDGTDSFRVGSPPNHREQEWISMELESNAATGTLRLYIYTQDGQLNGLYIERPIPTGGTWSFVDILGGYMNQAVQSDPNNYFMIDELKIDSTYIGPPQGFLSDPPPGQPGELLAQ